MTSMEKAEWFAGKAPPLTQVERDRINTLFPAYIFRRSKTREVWTTCCHRHEKLPEVTRSTAEYDLLMEPHQREPKNRWQEAPKESVACPFCGRLTIVKELGRTGKRDNLSRWRRAVVLRWYRGALWARAYDCGKHYNDGRSLTGEPDCHLIGVYRFKPGLAEASVRYFGNYPFQSIERQNGPLTKGRWNIPNPYHANSEYGIAYSVIGLDEVQKSPFRYCMAAEAERRTAKFMQFLTACCFYPRQIEMLMKAGMSDVVMDFVERGVKHAAVLNWDEESPARAFRVNRQDVKAFLGTSRDIQILELYKRLKGRATVDECAGWIGKELDIKATFGEAKKWSLPPEKLIRYLAGYIGCARYGGMSSLTSALSFWRDYLHAAEALGYQLHHENVLLPGKLGQAHDEATTRHRERLEQERQAAQRRAERRQRAEWQKKDRQMAEAYAKRRTKLEKKYGFALDGYVIRIPKNGEDILIEGRKLQHCVGGYADRHMNGKTTILFMRKEKHPDEPWLTIEMDGNELRQIHGFRNEGVHTAKGRFTPNPAEVYKDFLDTWLAWLKAGSRRDRDGKPILRERARRRRSA